MSPPDAQVPYGTLDLMVLNTLAGMGPLHGFGIARRIEQAADGALALNQGTIYPALLRLEQKGWIKSAWGTSDNNRRARFYSITAAGRRQLASQTELWARTVSIVNRLLEGAVMTRLRVFLSRTLDIVLGRRRDDRLSEEIQAHLDLLTAEHMKQGLGADEARLAARRAFGGVEQVKEDYRDQRGLPHLETLLQDVRLAVRLLRRDPGFAAAAVAVLGLGIGVNNMLFTILNAHTIRGLPIRDADRVVYLTTFDDRSPDLGVSFLDFTDWRSGARSFDALAAFTTEPAVFSGDGRAPYTSPERSSLPRRSPSSARGRCSGATSRRATIRLVPRPSSFSGAGLGIAVWTGSRHPRARDRGERRAGSHRRRDAGALWIPFERSGLAAALAGPRVPRAGTRRSHLECHRARPQRHRRVTRPGRNRNDHQTARLRSRRHEQTGPRAGGAHQRAVRRELHPSRMDRVRGGRHPRRPHLVRECGQPDARPLAEPIPRNCGSHGAWREPPAHHPTTLGRGSDARGSRRHSRSGPGDCRHAAF